MTFQEFVKININEKCSKSARLNLTDLDYKFEQMV